MLQNECFVHMFVFIFVFWRVFLRRVKYSNCYIEVLSVIIDECQCCITVSLFVLFPVLYNYLHTAFNLFH